MSIPAVRLRSRWILGHSLSVDLYEHLASWWPVISPVEGHAEEAAWIETLLPAQGSVLELGSGTGLLAHHLSKGLGMTLTDQSASMLAVSRELNPGCFHVEADMRELRLDRTFDAVLAHDAIDYMTTRSDLARAAATAYAHCAEDGVAVFVPDDLAETFVESTTLEENNAPDGRAARLVDWTWDPDPDDEKVQTEWLLLLRTAAGEVSVHHECHTFGLFGRQVWIDTLIEAGFSDVRSVEEPVDRPRTAFIAHRCV
ncbi:class I SAM-dependent methyltransferase [Kocuria soli]|uniref:Class I SAM-dependent methyltransferase n=1 Tax=Kocuria soli TaxID=2485125 RepID=A0A3N3ZVL1_9MICC|nr:class I SAM-dependent methyltransferase [Kocuria soli]ROZ64258.1 class I SAM-dependent methyltransferase [Kocuria soli]